MGSDTGGSVRIPAAVNGVVGLKPTYGRASKFGVTTLSWSLDTVGPLARSVEDCALVLEAIAGHDPRDPSTSRRPVERYAEGLDRGIKGLRVGVPREHYWDPLDPEVEKATRAAIAKLGELGAEIVEVSIPWVEYAFAPANLISWTESANYHTRWQDRWEADYGPEIQQRCVMGRAIAAPDYLEAQRVRRAIIARAKALFEQIDVLATPTAPCPAPLIANDTVKVGWREEPVRSAMGRLCRLGSLPASPSSPSPAASPPKAFPPASTSWPPPSRSPPPSAPPTPTNNPPTGTPVGQTSNGSGSIHAVILSAAKDHVAREASVEAGSRLYVILRCAQDDSVRRRFVSNPGVKTDSGAPLPRPVVRIPALLARAEIMHRRRHRDRQP